MNLATIHRVTLASAALLSVLVSPSRSAGAAPANVRRANIVMIEPDSWDGRALGILGHPGMRRATPNIDRLARRGTLVRQFYTNNPICCPSRASMWSGQQTWHCEGWNNYKGLEPDTPSALSHLAAAGYTFAGKGGGIGKLDYLSGAHSFMNRVGAWTGPAGIELPFVTTGAPRVLDNDDERLHQPDWLLVDRAREFLQSHATDAAPFFLYLGLNNPHPSYLTNRRYLAMVDVDAVTLPPEDRELHPVMRFQQATKKWSYGFSSETVRQTRAIYYAMCAETDAMIGAVLDEIDRLGLADNTYVIFTSDHGDNAMEHHQWYKMNMYESSVRVPFVVAGPGVQHGVVRDELGSLVDLFPTLMDMAGLPTPAGLDGESLLPLLTGKSGRRRDWVAAMYSDFTVNTTLYMLRRGDWKYVAYPGYEPQLFNLRRDPDEVDNRARAEPEETRRMDAALRQIVDYEAVHRRVIAYDKASFSAWREELLARPAPYINSFGKAETRRDGTPLVVTYEQAMAKIYPGWGPEQEAKIKRWLETSP